MNYFKEDNEFSLSASQMDFWDAVYEEAFPDLYSTEIINLSEYEEGSELYEIRLKQQLAGIDRIVRLNSGRLLYVDEKSRRRSLYYYKDEGDLFLETVSNDKTGALGWIEKDNQFIDYLAYASVKDRAALLFPWQTLRRVWIKNRREWNAKYGGVPAHNPGYTSWGCTVPLPVLLEAVTGALMVHV